MHAAYEVVVGNVGTVDMGGSRAEASRIYGQYRAQSRRGVGRAADEPVTLLCHGAIVREYQPPSA